MGFVDVVPGDAVLVTALFALPPELGHGFAELALESLWLGRMVEIGAWFRH